MKNTRSIVLRQQSEGALLATIDYSGCYHYEHGLQAGVAFWYRPRLLPLSLPSFSKYGVKMMIRILPFTLAGFVVSLLITSQAGAQRGQMGELYGMGVHAYNSHDYESAEEYLTSAIEQGSEDPRCYFFRGLCRLSLNRIEEAEADFQTGAELEFGGADRSYPVGTSLHRVQGNQRLRIEEHRMRSRTAALERNAVEQQANRNRHRGNEEEVLRSPGVVPPTDALPLPEDDVVGPFGEDDLAGGGSTTPSVIDPSVTDREPLIPAEPTEGDFPSQPEPLIPETPAEGGFPSELEPLFPVEPSEGDFPSEPEPLFPEEPVEGVFPSEGEDEPSGSGSGVIESIFEAFRKSVPRVPAPSLPPGLLPGTGSEGTEFEEGFPGGEFPEGDIFPDDSDSDSGLYSDSSSDATSDPFENDNNPFESQPLEGEGSEPEPDGSGEFDNPFDD